MFSASPASVLIRFCLSVVSISAMNALGRFLKSMRLNKLHSVILATLFGVA